MPRPKKPRSPNKPRKTVSVKPTSVKKTSRQSIEDFFRPFKRLPVPMAMTRVDGTPFIEVNDTFLRLFEYTSEEVIGATTTELNFYADREDRGRLIARIQKERGVVSNYELVARTKTGKYVVLLLSADIISIDGIQYLMTSAIDITERKQAEEALRESESNFRALADNSTAAIFIVQEEKFVYINRNFTESAGYTLADLASVPFWDIISPEMRDQVRANAAARQQHSDRAPRHYELKIITKSGEEKIAQVGVTGIEFNKRTAILGLVVDITERKEAERKLQESEAMLAHAQQLAHVGHWDRDLPTGNVRWSDETYRIFGFEPQACEVHGPFLLQHVHPDDRAHVEKALRDAKEWAKPYNEIYRLVRPDGSIRWVHARGEVTRTPDGKPIRVFGAILDITARQQMEEELRKSRDELELRVQERTAELERAYENLRLEVKERQRGEDLLSATRLLASALSGTSDLTYALDLCLDTAIRVSGMDIGGIYVVNQLTGEVDLAVHRNLSQELYAAVSHYGADSFNARLVMAGTPVYTTFEKTSLPEVKEPFRALAIIPIRHNEEVLACLNLGSRTVDEIAPPMRNALETVAAQIGGALRRIQTEEERMRLATAVEHTGEAILLVDKFWTIRYVNPATTRISGYQAYELIGKNISMLRSGDIEPSVYETAKKHAELRGAWLGILQHERKNGDSFPAEALTSTLKDEGGDITGYVVLLRDISKRIELEERLRQSQKMEAIGTLAGGIAHDFNNILAVIIGFTEMVIDDVSDNAQAQHKMERVLKAALRGRDLVSQILAFSRKTEGKQEELSLTPLIKETHELLRASLPTTIQMNLAFTASDDRVLADPTQLQQVIMNLATNAADAMREGGQLTIALSSVTLGEASLLPDPDMEPGTYMKLTVKDTGTGIAEEIRQRIFEPFFTTKEPGKGTGMGLSVVYGIVKAHGGAVTVQSEIGQGSTFAVYLPRAQKLDVKKEETTVSALPTGTERILFVDDEELLVEMAQNMLESLGYAVTVAQHPTEAWNLFLEDPSRFDLIITDQTMPDITGLTLAQNMLRVREEMPVILCTGYSEMVSADKAKEAGIRAFVMKPVMKKELAETVRRVLDGRKTGV